MNVSTRTSYALLHKQTQLLRSSDPSDPFGQGLQLSGVRRFTSSALTFSLDHSSSCAAARLRLVRGQYSSGITAVERENTEHFGDAARCERDHVL